jgi:DNA-binding SARP family transcriptional activator
MRAPSNRPHAGPVRNARGSLTGRFQRSFSESVDAPAVSTGIDAGRGIPNPSGEGYRRPVEFRVLGSIEVFEDGNGSIPLGGPKQRAVLAHLLLRANHLVPTEVLIDEVWGEDPPETARNALQSYASHLRKSLGSTRLEGSRAGYRLRTEPSELDADRFRSLLRDARRLLPIDARAAVGAFDHALALWRGPAFADLAAEPSLQAEAARLDDLRLGALEDRIEAQLTTGQHGDVIGELETLTARHPLRERFWEQLMLALYRSGRQGEALATYRRARETLADELGIDPSPGLRVLHERILSQSADLDLGGEPLRGYRLLERVGENAFGSIFRAAQPNVGRDVAVRIVHEHRANDPAFVRRFEADAQAVAALEHPRVTPVYDYWREPGRAYIVSRFLRGGSLRGLLDRSGPLDRDRSAPILAQVAEGLMAAHIRGVTHGSIRPSNVLFDEEGNAYLTDFSFGTPAVRKQDDLAAFVALVRETFGRRLPADLADVLGRVETVTGLDDVPSAFATLVAAIGANAEPSLMHAASIRNPYKGLRPFLEADAQDFFGREAFVRRLLERLATDGGSPRFTAVVGPSGSGKSSVVRAGLVSAIHAGMLPDSGRWLVTDMHPGRHPLEELDAALMRIAVHPPAGMLARLESGPRGLLEVAQAIMPEDGQLLLVVDQFEELFTLSEDESERALMLESLRVVTADPGSRVRVVATLRADFYDRPLRYPRIGPLLASTTEVLSPLTPEELERAIVRPAERSGLRVDSALVPQIAADVAEQPGALPLVQYALTELYDRRDDRRLTLDGYREIGGVGGALAASAEHLYATRHETGREAIRQLFLRLVTLGEGAADTRRRVPMSELSVIELDRLAMEAAIDSYGRHRLLTFDRDPATREPTVEIAHEALLIAWDRLHDWVDEAREDVRIRRRLADAAREWEHNDRDPSFLLSGSRLDQFEAWESSTTVALGLGERGFLTASVSRRGDEHAMETERRERERSLERSSVKRLRALAAALTVGILVAGVLTAVALDRNAEAQHASQLANARELVSAATANLERDRQLGLLLLLEAAGTPVDGAILPGVEELLRRAAPAVSIDATALIGSGISSYAFTPDGEAVAVVGGDGSVGVWDLTTGARRLTLPSPKPCGSSFGGSLVGVGVGSDLIGCPDVFRVDLSDDVSLLAVGDGNRRAAVWDLGSGRRIISVAPEARPPRNGQPGSAPTVAFSPAASAPAVALSPDGRLLATGGTLGTVRLWDIETGQMLWSTATGSALPGLRRPLATPWRDLMFDPNGTRLFFSFPGQPFVAIDVRTGRTLTLTRDRFWQALSADGPRGPWGSTISRDVRLAAEIEGSDVRLWHREDPDDSSIGSWGADTLLEGHAQGIEAAAFSADGERLATGSLDGTVRVWNTSSEDVIFTSPVEPSGVEGVAFSPDGSRVTAIYGEGSSCSRSRSMT